MSTISSGTTSTTTLVHSGDTTGSLVFKTNDTGSGGTTAMTIDTSQNVGVGITSPSLKLHVKSSSNDVLMVESSNTYAFLDFTNPTGTAGIGNTGNVMRFDTGGSERMRIDSSGNLLVGGTNTYGNGNTKLVVQNTGSDKVGGISVIGAPTTQQNGVSLMLGATTAGANYGATFFQHVQQGATAATDWGFNISLRKTDGTYVSNVYNCSYSGQAHEWYNPVTAASNMLLDSSGNFRITGATATKASGTTWANPSDQRLKDNIADYTKGLTELLQVRVRTWDYNGKGGTTQGLKGLGVIADEVMLVLPETVDTYEAKLNPEDEQETEIKRFDATEITWLLVKSIQELKALVDAQATEIAELKAKVG